MPQEVLLFISIVLLVALSLWGIKNVTLSDNCPQCKSNKDVKRGKRSFFTKYMLFFLR